jgi:hypothetical protein
MSTDMEIALLQKIQKQKTMPVSSPLNITAFGCSQSTASFAQQRVWFDENLYNDPSTSLALHNLLLPLVIKRGSMSIERIRSAIVTILEQHTILRTAIHYDEKRDTLTQQVQSIVGTDNYSFQLTKESVQSTDEIAILLKNESTNHFAKLDRGLVVRCHLIKMGVDDNNEYLKPNDLIIFVFHRIAFDYNSVGPFIIAFTQAYNQIKSHTTNLQYIDFTLYEKAQLADVSQNSKMNKARQFWSKQMDDYNLNDKYALPIASKQEINKRSGRGHSAAFDLDSDIVEAQIEFASSYNMSMFHLGLACYFIFLYELNNGSIKDICVACPTDNRPLMEMKSMIGMFINILPYRMEIEPNRSFVDFVQCIRRLCIDVLEHAQLPYQLIMSDKNSLCPSKIPFHFRYDSIDSLTTEDMTLEPKTKDGTFSLYTDRAWLHGNGVASNDLTLTMIHNIIERKTHCVFECSNDCYNETAASNMIQYFQNLLTHVFAKNTMANELDQTIQPITNLCLQIQNIKQRSHEVLQKRPNVSETGKLSNEYLTRIQ